MNIKLQIILLVSLPIVFIFFSAVASLAFALHYSRQQISLFSENLFQNQLIYSQQFTQLLSFQLHNNVQKLSFYLVILNSYYSKIRDDKVQFNDKYRHTLLDILQIYNENGDPYLLNLYKKNHLLTSSWYHQNTTNLNELNLEEYNLLMKMTRLDPLIRAIYAQDIQQYNSSERQLSIYNTYFGFQDSGMLYSNSFNSSLNVPYNSTCSKGKFNYDVKCRYWYYETIKEFSLILHKPAFSYADVVPYITQQLCQKMLKKGSKSEVDLVLCIEKRLSSILYYFQNFVKSTKQWYIIQPNSQVIIYDSKFPDQLNNINTLQQIEFDWLDDDSDTTLFKQKLNENFSKWVYKTYSRGNLSKITDLYEDQLIFPYKRNGTMHTVILDPVFVFDRIPTYVDKELYNKNYLQAEVAYLMINIISDADLQEQTKELLEFSQKFYIAAGTLLIASALISICISLFYAIQINNLVNAPIHHLTVILKKISDENNCSDLSIFFSQYQLNSKEIFLSKETSQLYESFQGVFNILLYTTDNFFKEDQTKTLLRLCKKVDFLRQFHNIRAVGITHNNIGVILLNQGHYFQALEHFSNSIVYSKYEIQSFCSTYPVYSSIQNLNQFCFIDKQNFDENGIKRNSTNLYDTRKKNSNNYQQLKSLYTEKANSSVRTSEQNIPEYNSKLFNESQQKMLSQQKPFINSNNTILDPTQKISCNISDNKQIIQQAQDIEDQQQSNDFFHFKSKINQINISKIDHLQGGTSTIIQQQKEEEELMIQLLSNLFYRKQNYVVTLIAFQESLDIRNTENKNIDNFFNFWHEIKDLLIELLPIIKYLPIGKALKIAILTQISKCQFNLNTINNSEKSLSKSSYLLNKMILTGEENQKRKASKQQQSQKNIKQQGSCKNLYDLAFKINNPKLGQDQLESKRKKSKLRSYSQQNKKKTPQLTPQSTTIKSLKNQLMNNGTKLIPLDLNQNQSHSNFEQKSLKRLRTSEEKLGNLSLKKSPTSKQETLLQLDQNHAKSDKFDSSVHEIQKSQNKLSIIQSQSYQKQSKIIDSNFQSKLDETLKKITYKIIPSVQDIQEPNLENYFEKQRQLKQKRELSQLYYFKVEAEYLLMGVLFTKAEFLIHEKIYDEAAYYLTAILEKSRRIMSHYLFRVVDKLKTIFDHYNFISPQLNQIKRKFNPNISFQVATIFAVNNNSQATLKSLKLLSDTFSQVLTKQGDKIGIVLINQDDGYIEKYISLTKVSQIKILINLILSEINSLISSKNTESLLQSQLISQTSLQFSNSLNQIKSPFHKDKLPFIKDKSNIQNSIILPEPFDQEQLGGAKFQTSIQYNYYQEDEINENKFDSQSFTNQHNCLPQPTTFLNSFQIQKDSEDCKFLTTLKTNPNISKLQTLEEVQQSIINDKRINFLSVLNLPPNNEQFFKVNDHQGDTTELFLNTSKSSINSYLDNNQEENQNIDRNYQFHQLMRKTIDQIFYEQMSFHHLKYSNFMQRNHQQQEKQRQQNKIFLKEENEIYNVFYLLYQDQLQYTSTLKFIIYNTDIIDIIKNTLFDKLYIQLIIHSSKKGQNFLETQIDNTYQYEQKDIIKVFYSSKQIISYLNSNRDQFSKTTYTTYLQHF